ncbi:MAG: hypothetical protein HZA37_02620 [Parcubacteria group bacterium]|nr:hypothetical protein [Parcubacteria group bacterium]
MNISTKKELAIALLSLAVIGALVYLGQYYNLLRIKTAAPAKTAETVRAEALKFIVSGEAAMLAGKITAVGADFLTIQVMNANAAAEEKKVLITDSTLIRKIEMDVNGVPDSAGLIPAKETVIPLADLQAGDSIIAALRADSTAVIIDLLSRPIAASAAGTEYIAAGVAEALAANEAQKKALAVPLPEPDAFEQGLERRVVSGELSTFRGLVTGVNAAAMSLVVMPSDLRAEEREIKITKDSVLESVSPPADIHIKTAKNKIQFSEIHLNDTVLVYADKNNEAVAVAVIKNQ